MERDLKIASKLVNLDEVRIFLNEVFTESGVNMVLFNKVFIGLSEAVNNSILHGNGLDASKNVFITVQCNTDHILIDVRDEGNGFDLSKIEDPLVTENRKKESGRGIFLIRHFADEVNFFEKGQRVRIKFQLNK